MRGTGQAGSGRPGTCAEATRSSVEGGGWPRKPESCLKRPQHGERSDFAGGAGDEVAPLSADGGRLVVGYGALAGRWVAGWIGGWVDRVPGGRVALRAGAWAGTLLGGEPRSTAAQMLNVGGGARPRLSRPVQSQTRPSCRGARGATWGARRPLGSARRRGGRVRRGRGRALAWRHLPTWGWAGKRVWGPPRCPPKPGVHPAKAEPGFPRCVRSLQSFSNFAQAFCWQSKTRPVWGTCVLLGVKVIASVAVAGVARGREARGSRPAQVEHERARDSEQQGAHEAILARAAASAP